MHALYNTICQNHAPRSTSIMASTSSAAAASAADEAWKTSDNPMDFCDVLGVSGANKHLRCKLCKKEFKGTGSRAYDHLIVGKDVTKCTAIEAAAAQRLKAAKAAKLHKWLPGAPPPRAPGQ